MHEHPATKDAIQRLVSRNNIHIPAQEGELARVRWRWTDARTQ